MKKSIIIIGKQSTGKTTKLKEILSSHDKSKVIELEFNELQSLIDSPVSYHIETIVIEEVYSTEQFDYIINTVNQTGLQFIITTQSDVKELFKTNESFETIVCGADF